MNPSDATPLPILYWSSEYAGNPATDPFSGVIDATDATYVWAVIDGQPSLLGDGVPADAVRLVVEMDDDKPDEPPVCGDSAELALGVQAYCIREQRPVSETNKHRDAAGTEWWPVEPVTTASEEQDR